MSTIILSPSQQPANMYADGSGSEQQHMERIVDHAARDLRTACHTVHVPKTGDYRTQVTAGNRVGAFPYIAVHSDATGTTAKRRGVAAFVMPAGVDDEGRRLGAAICARVAALGIPNLGLKDGQALYEVNGPLGPSCLLELDYHDHLEGAAWITAHERELGRAIALGYCDVYGGTLAATSTPATTTGDTMQLTDKLTHPTTGKPVTVQEVLGWTLANVEAIDRKIAGLSVAAIADAVLKRFPAGTTNATAEQIAQAVADVTAKRLEA